MELKNEYKYIINNNYSIQNLQLFFQKHIEKGWSSPKLEYELTFSPYTFVPNSVSSHIVDEYFKFLLLIIYLNRYLSIPIKN